jgi:hypothetical protein
MKKTYHKFLIISTVAIFFSGAYIYFSNDLKNEAFVPVAFGSSLSSSNEVDNTTSTSPLSEKLAEDISFLTTLVSLKNITIDTNFFENNSFKILQDNRVKLEIESVNPGRLNPFSPINTSAVNNIKNTSSGVVTDLPTQITETTAVLNGTINTSSKVTDIYFEYGPTEALGTLTSTVKQSLVGTFIKTVSGLNPQTTYFSKACVKINNTALCGEVVSFTTK